ncbi:MAG TPA: hypothetical protein VIY49_01905 [Bryobacteraceae bacterium]
MTLIFETKKFRVQIVGKSAWVETSEGGRWVLRSQINLPVNLSIARARSGIPVLRAAVEHYERARNGDQALRAALTGTVVKEKQAVSPTTAEAPRQWLQTAQRQGALNNGGRGPLRPPLVRLEIGLPQRA